MENVKEVIHEIVDHLDLSPRHRLRLHGQIDDPAYDDNAEPVAAAPDATPVTAEAAPLSDREVKIAALKAQLAERAQDEEIAALQAQLATPAASDTATEPTPEGA